MAETAPSSSSAAGSAVILITSVSPNDVLLGRGTGSNEFIGNQKYRQYVEERREEYIAAEKIKAKTQIAQEVYDRVHALGGRFLKKVQKKDLPPGFIKKDAYYAVKASVALEKCKQSLREKRQTSPDSDGSDHGSEVAYSLPDGAVSGVPSRDFTSSSGVAVGTPCSASVPVHSLRATSILPSMLTASADFHCVNPNGLVFPSDSVALQGLNIMSQPRTTSGVPHSRLNTYHCQQQQYVAPYAARGIPSELVPQKQHSWGRITGHQQAGVIRSLPSLVASTDSQSKASVKNDRTGASPVKGIASAESPSTTRLGSSDPASGEDVTEFLLSCLDAVGRPMFTDEQIALEQAMLTDEERAAVLSDLFGTYCAVDTPVRKRARQDLDRASIAFLVMQMRIELARIPVEKKQAMMEAERKCHADEFSDARLEQFLRCEKMNHRLAAERFVAYWEGRKEVFGPEKFVLRMTLSEALHDDIVALETGMCCLLPNVDSFGRPIMIWETRRHTREGYSFDSMIRALWYINEVTANQNTDVAGGIVQIVWDRDSTILDYDRKLGDLMVRFERTCWPLRIAACHICCAPGLLIPIIKPLMFAFMDTRTRSRTLVHDVPDKQILGVLSEYGILKGMLPTEMGGTIKFNQIEWIAGRRAAELEEI